MLRLPYETTAHSPRRYEQQTSQYADPFLIATAGLHCEGGVWATLFGLLMWSVMFADVAEVFRTPFQTAPLDLGTEAFFSARRRLIEARLQEIRCVRAPH